MEKSQWLAGAFDAYGLASNMGKDKVVSLLTTSEHYEHINRFKERTGFGRITAYKGRYQWTCDDPTEIQLFYQAVSMHLTEHRRQLIETAWETWRQRVEESEGQDVGPIDKPPAVEP